MADGFEAHIAFARSKLGDLKDSSGTLIFDHAVRVFLLLRDAFNREQRDLGRSERDMLAAALFHDLLEDTDAKEEEILALAGSETLLYVRELTITFENRSIAEAVRPLQTISEQAFLVKLADILDNCTKSRFLAREGGAKFFRNFFVPLMDEYLRLIDERLPHCALFGREASGLAASIRVSAKQMLQVVDLIVE